MGADLRLPAGAAVPCLVLDPFGDSGTTALVAEQMGRDSILVELKPEYVALAVRQLGPLIAALALL